ncbi:MAG: L-threonylcarbamoyladenylate synthase, partial [Elusimicrobia bacterium]|nr:L-threonylcarbamoyladenylate synthase [Elusimicrobiota bacterium]
MIRTRVLRPNGKTLAMAADILRAGGLVAFPTETVYGLGARAYDPAAARRVYKAKGRPSDNPLIVHVCDEAMLADAVKRVTPLARRLMDAFWPGPLTLILEKSARVPGAVTAGGRTVAVRCPGHPAARALIRALGEPIAAPSANLSGRPSPTTAAHVLRDLRGRVALILDGGPCRKGLESAIVDARGRRPIVLRHGTLTGESISRAAGVPLGVPGRSAPASPGTRHRHYAPSCRVILVPPALVRRGALP